MSIHDENLADSRINFWVNESRRGLYRAMSDGDQIHEQHGVEDFRRRRNQTEKYKLFKMDALLKQRSKLHKKLMNKIDTVNALLDSTINIQTVREEMDLFDDLFTNFSRVNEDYHSLGNEGEQKEISEWFENIDETICSFKRKIKNWLIESEREREDAKSRASTHSRSSKGSSKGSKHSSRSSKSSGSSTKERAMKEKLKMAELIAKAEYMEKIQQAEHQKQKLKVEEEVAKAKARMLVLEQQEDKGSQVPLQTTSRAEDVNQMSNKPQENQQQQTHDGKLHQQRQQQQFEDDKNNRRLTEFEEIKRKLQKFEDENKRKLKSQVPGKEDTAATDVLCQILKQQAAPEVDMECFEGNPVNYHYFIALFKEVVENKIDDSRGRLTRLIKYTKGEARDLIKHCIQQPVGTGYQTARHLLDQRYGNPHTVLASYRKEIKLWPQIKFGDAKGFQKFHNFLIKCQSVADFSKWNALDTPDVLCLLVSKFPGSLIDRWSRKVLGIRRHQLREPNLQDLIELVEIENALVHDPMFSREAIMEHIPTREKPSGRGNKFKAHATKTDDSGDKLVGECPLCGKKHDLDDCKLYLELQVNERSKTLFKNKLCYGCYKPISTSHNARTCENRRICQVCGGKHPTGLHGYEPKRKPHRSSKADDTDKRDSMASNCIEMSCAAAKFGEVLSMCVVPVKVKHEGSSKIIHTYAMLDNCSQGTFVKKNLLSSLEVNGEQTSINIRTLNGSSNHEVLTIEGLTVSSATGEDWIKLPRSYTRNEIPADPEEVATKSKLQHWKYLDPIAKEIGHHADIDVKLLIGANCLKALEPVEVISSQKGGPYAYRTRLGWCIVGPMKASNVGDQNIKCNRVVVSQAGSKEMSKHHFIHQDEVQETAVKDMLLKMYQADFVEQKVRAENFFADYLQELSIEDRRFLDMMKNQTVRVGQHYQLPLPFKNPDVKMPNNITVAEKRLQSLKRKLQKNPTFYDHYKTFMDDLMKKGYARKCKGEPPDGKKWYLPHHGVYHPAKPGKVRVVFDCSAEYLGTSINKELLSGPDLTNQIVGTLTKFRKEPVAFMADIEAMFFQVFVPEEQRSFLRFLWWENADLSRPHEDHEMCVHLFGGTSSPGCSNYAIKDTSEEYKEEFGILAADTLKKNFYVDDCLKSVLTVEEAIQLIQNVKGMCAAGGFNLTKFISNNKEVLQSIPDADRKKGVKDCDLSKGTLPTDRALGVMWNTEEDTFGFKIQIKQKPFTRRGMLSMLSSMYDPMGFISPFMLTGRKIIQELCEENLSWDQAVPDDIKTRWQAWQQNLFKLEEIKIPRCFKPRNFGKIIDSSLHHFSDASEEGYGQSTYLRLVDDQGKIHCSLVIGKSRVAPLKFVSIPRMELVAATLSVKISELLKPDLEYENLRQIFWTDSKVVLGYINNKSKRFKIFVANRVQQIHQYTLPSQWMYIPTKENPADDASRGLDATRKDKVQRWFHGPEFLWNPESTWSINEEVASISTDDPELKKSINVNQIQIKESKYSDILTGLEERISSWSKMKRIFAYALRFIRLTLKKIADKKFIEQHSEFDVQLIEEAGIMLIKMLQHKHFEEDMRCLSHNEASVKKNSRIVNLDPFVDENGILRVGGRLKMSSFGENLKHPVLLPKGESISKLVIKHCHEKVAHGGRGITLNEIRNHGFWIIDVNSAVRNFIAKCITCNKLRGRTGDQKMSDLPLERLSEDPPFTFCGVDMFGPFIIKQRRSQVKRYGAMFTCMSSRAVHIEITHSMDADSFIQSLRRMIARRGNVRTIYSDNGTNFGGAETELNAALKKMEWSKIKEYLISVNTDWIEWKKNPPSASHMGGVWERQIRSARAILASLLQTHAASLDDESLQTLMAETENIINSRPLTVETISDSNSEIPISPSNLLTMKTKVVLPPPGEFPAADVYSKRRWRRVQHICNEFWQRWRKEFLVTLQQRHKWVKPTRNFATGDIVLLKTDQTLRNQWPMAKIINVNTGNDGLVRSATIRVGSTDAEKATCQILERPIHKLVLLMKNDEVEI